MGALLETIQFRINELAKQRAEAAVRAEQVQVDFDAAIALLVQTRDKLEKDPELEALYENIVALNVLPQTRPR